MKTLFGLAAVAVVLVVLSPASLTDAMPRLTQQGTLILATVDRQGRIRSLHPVDVLGPSNNNPGDDIRQRPAGSLRAFGIKLGGNFGGKEGQVNIGNPGVIPDFSKLANFGNIPNFAGNIPNFGNPPPGSKGGVGFNVGAGFRIG